MKAESRDDVIVRCTGITRTCVRHYEYTWNGRRTYAAGIHLRALRE